MIESYLQIICEGCGATEPDSIPWNTYKSLRQEMKKYGWRNYGTLDYCNVCVANGKARDRYSMFEGNPPSKAMQANYYPAMLTKLNYHVQILLVKSIQHFRNRVIYNVRATEL